VEGCKEVSVSLMLGDVGQLISVMLQSCVDGKPEEGYVIPFLLRTRYAEPQSLVYWYQRSRCFSAELIEGVYFVATGSNFPPDGKSRVPFYQTERKKGRERKTLYVKSQKPERKKQGESR